MATERERVASVFSLVKPANAVTATNAPVDARREMLRRTVRDACTILGTSRCFLTLLDAAGGELITEEHLGFARTTPPPARIPLRLGVAGWVGMQRKPACIDDVAGDERHHLGADAQAKGAMLCVPLLEGNALFGTITVASDRCGAFGARHLAMLQVIADLAASQLGRMRQSQDALLQQQQLSLLLNATRTMTSLLKPAEIFANITRSIQHLVRYEDALIYAFEPIREELRVVAGEGVEAQRLVDTRVKLSDPQTLSASVARTRHAISHAPDTHSLVPGRVTEAFMANRPMALLCVPLTSKELLRGVITLGRPSAFSAHEVRMMEEFAPLIATALENMDLYSAVKSEKERLAAIFTATADGIAVVDGTGHIVEVNGAFAQMAGRPIDHVKGERFLAAFTPPGAPPDATRTDVTALTQAVRDALQGRQTPVLLECEMPGAGTLSRHILLSIAPVTHPSGRHVVVVGRDVTDLRALDRTRTQMLQMISHEIRAPLQPLSGYLEMALRGMAGPLSERQSDLIRRAQAVSKHLAACVKDFSLILTQEDAQGFPLDIELVEMHKVLQSAIEEAELQAAERGICLHAQYPAQLPQIAGNSERLGQVVRNLLNNALKFTPRGGHIWVEAHATAQMMEIAVADTGCGIAGEHLPFIFERFYQAPEGQGQMHGTGLGLAIVKMIIERHGGQVRVTSKSGQGSRFSCLLPIRSLVDV